MGEPRPRVPDDQIQHACLRQDRRGFGDNRQPAFRPNVANRTFARASKRGFAGPEERQHRRPGVRQEFRCQLDRAIVADDRRHGLRTLEAGDQNGR